MANNIFYSQSKPELFDDKPLRERGVSEDGINFLKASLAPFNHERPNFNGLPDAACDQSLCQIVTKSNNVTAPAGTTNSWSCVVFTTPLDDSAIGTAARAGVGFARSTKQLYRGFRVPVGTSVTFATYNVWAWKSDVNVFFPDGSGTWTAPDAAYAISALPSNTASPPSPMLVGDNLRYRVIGSGFDIHNTTAEINLQGSVTSVRVPTALTREPDIYNCTDASVTPTNVPFLWDGVSSNAPANFQDLGGLLEGISHTIFQAPPSTVAAALQFGGSQWNAKDGIYNFNSYNHSMNDFSQRVNGPAAMVSGDFTKQVGTTLTNVLVDSVCEYYSQAFADAASTTPQDDRSSMKMHHISPRDTVCHYFQGLSPETTLLLTTRTALELAPRANDSAFSNMIPNLKASPLVDQKALDLYQQVAARLPHAYPVSMNETGGAAKSVFSWLVRLAKAAVPAATMYNPILGAAVGGAAGIGSRILSSFNSRGPTRASSRASSRAFSSRASSRGSVRSIMRKTVKIAGKKKSKNQKKKK